MNSDRLTAIGIPSSQFEDPNLLGIAPRASSFISPVTSRFAALSSPTDVDIEAIGANWIAQGPSPITNGQTENVRNATGVLDNQVVGAIHTVLADPKNANNLWVGTVNGGIWRTNTANQATPPVWTPLTDQFRGLSISAMTIDSTDPEGDGPIIIAGTGHVSSYNEGGPLTGLLISTNGGDTFREIGSSILQGESVSGIVKRGDTILVSTDHGVYRSIDNGANWRSISGRNGLTGGQAFDLVSDPTTPQRVYVSIQGQGIFLSDNISRPDDPTNPANDGASWVNISNLIPGADNSALTGNGRADLNTAITTAGNNNTEMAISSNGRIYVGVLRDGRPVYIGFSNNQGANWTQMDLPVTPDNDPGGGGLNPEEEEEPGGQGGTNFSIAADPTSADIVYVGGDLQPALNLTNPFPNSIGANDYSGRLFRGNVTRLRNTGGVTASYSPQWEPLTHGSGGFDPDGPGPRSPEGGTANNSAPHADSRGCIPVMQ